MISECSYNKSYKAFKLLYLSTLHILYFVRGLPLEFLQRKNFSDLHPRKSPLGVASREYSNYGVFAEMDSSMALWVVGGSRRLCTLHIPL